MKSTWEALKGSIVFGRQQSLVGKIPASFSWPTAWSRYCTVPYSTYRDVLDTALHSHCCSAHKYPTPEKVRWRNELNPSALFPFLFFTPLQAPPEVAEGDCLWRATPLLFFFRPLDREIDQLRSEKFKNSNRAAMPTTPQASPPCLIMGLASASYAREVTGPAA